MMPGELVHIGFKAPIEIKELWESLAEAEERSLSQWLRRQVKIALEAQGQPFEAPAHETPGKKSRNARRKAA